MGGMQYRSPLICMVLECEGIHNEIFKQILMLPRNGSYAIARL